MQPPSERRRGRPRTEQDPARPVWNPRAFRVLLAAHGRSLNDIAAAAGIHPKTLHKWLGRKGDDDGLRRGPRVEDLRALADALEVDPEVLTVETVAEIDLSGFGQ